MADHTPCILSKIEEPFIFRSSSVCKGRKAIISDGDELSSSHEAVDVQGKQSNEWGSTRQRVCQANKERSLQVINNRKP
jgi:hypothetical protein